jgi:effector-binding domain-containing protein
VAPCGTSLHFEKLLLISLANQTNTAMPKMHIDKSIEIDVPASKVFNIISDFNQWTVWSPWLIMEPEAKVTVSDDGKSYSWEGDKVGSGEMKITSEETDKRLDIDLTFLKPWKSKAKVWFELKEGAEGKTNLHWLMDSSIPFFLFWMTKSMTAYVGMDYERGLFMLKDYVESGTVPSKLNMEGVNMFGGCSYIGINKACTIEEVGPEMSGDFEKINEWIESNQENIAGIPFSIYHKWDMVNRQVEYTSGVPVKEAPTELPQDFVSGDIPKTSVYTISHTGTYKHLGNAWSAGYNLIQNKAFKSNKKIHPFEVYETMPGSVPENELVTKIHFPAK